MGANLNKVDLICTFQRFHTANGLTALDKIEARIGNTLSTVPLTRKTLEDSDNPLCGVLDKSKAKSIALKVCPSIALCMLWWIGGLAS